MAEVWALGVLLSFLLTGTSPFPSDEDKLAGNVKIDGSLIRRLSGDCMHLLRRCLQADPKQRATIAEIKAHPWLMDAHARHGTREAEDVVENDCKL